jgi:hypothetical protein
MRLGSNNTMQHCASPKSGLGKVGTIFGIEKNLMDLNSAVWGLLQVV